MRKNRALPADDPSHDNPAMKDSLKMAIAGRKKAEEKKVIESVAEKIIPVVAEIKAKDPKPVAERPVIKRGRPKKGELK